MNGYLRLAAIGGCFAAVTFFVILWQRSYGIEDNLRTPVPGLAGGVEFESYRGRLIFWGRFRNNPFELEYYYRETLSVLFGCSESRDFRLWVPHWCAIAAVGVIAGAPRFQWRFTLRTLLIAMTLLGLLLASYAPSAQSAWFSRQLDQVRQGMAQPQDAANCCFYY